MTSDTRGGRPFATHSMLAVAGLVLFLAAQSARAGIAFGDFSARLQLPQMDPGRFEYTVNNDAQLQAAYNVHVGNCYSIAQGSTSTFDGASDTLAYDLGDHLSPGVIAAAGPNCIFASADSYGFSQSVDLINPSDKPFVAHLGGAASTTLVVVGKGYAYATFAIINETIHSTLFGRDYRIGSNRAFGKADKFRVDLILPAHSTTRLRIDPSVGGGAIDVAQRAPEISAGSAANALTLLVGAILITARRLGRG